MSKIRFPFRSIHCLITFFLASVCQTARFPVDQVSAGALQFKVMGALTEFLAAQT